MNDQDNQNQSPNGAAPSHVALALNDPERVVNSGAQVQSQTPAREGVSQDVFARFQKRSVAVQRDAEKKAAATETEFIEESLNRGFGVRPVVPIRSEELKAKSYKLGFVFALVLGFLLGAINANQVIDENNIQLPWLLQFVLIAAVVAFSLFGFEFVSKSILTAVLDLSSFRNAGALTIKRWFIYLGLAFVCFGVISLWLRADTGLPELAGIICFMLWEWLTVAIAALSSLAYGYHAWSGDLARQYEDALSVGYWF